MNLSEGQKQRYRCRERICEYCGGRGGQDKFLVNIMTYTHYHVAKWLMGSCCAAQGLSPVLCDDQRVG